MRRTAPPSPARHASTAPPRVTLAQARAGAAGGARPLAPDQARRFAHDFAALPLRPRPAAAALPGPAGWQVAAPDSPAEQQAAAAARATPGGGPALAPPPAGLAAVRLHDGPAAARVAGMFAARAVTLGRDIYFAPGQYAPASAAGQHLLAHEVAHALQPEPGIAFREPLTKRAGRWWDATVEDIGKTWDETKWAAYRGMIAALKKGKTMALAPLRNQVPKLPALAQGSASGLLDIVDFVADLNIALLLIITGTAVGFTEGLVGMVSGLVRLTWRLLEYIVECFAAWVGHPEAAQEDTEKLLAALRNLKPALKAAYDAWWEKHAKASPEEQAIMEAELLGQLLAFIATFALGAAKGAQAGTALGESGAKMLNAAAKGSGLLEPAFATASAGGKGGGALAGAASKAPAIAGFAGQGVGAAGVTALALQKSGGSGAGGGGGGTSGGGGAPPPAVLDAATAQAKAEINAERAAVTARRAALPPGEWATSRAGLTKRLYNLMEHHAALIRMKAFPNSTWLEQVTVKGVEVNGELTTTEKIAGKGRIPDLLELKGDQAVFEDLKSASTQTKSVAGGMKKNVEIEAVFRDSSEIAQQHAVEEKVLAEARARGGRVVVEGRDPMTGQVRVHKLDPNRIGSRVTDYGAVGNN